MSKSIRNILIYVVIILILFFISIIRIMNVKAPVYNISKSINEAIVNIGSDGFIEVEQIVKATIKSGDKKNMLIPLVFYEDYNPDYEDKLNKIKYKTAYYLDVTVDGNQLPVDGMLTVFERDYTQYYSRNSDYINLHNTYSLQDDSIIKITYRYKIEEAIDEYINNTILRLNNNTEHATYKMKIIFPKMLSNITTSYNENIIEKINDNTYTINLSTARGDNGYIDLILDKDIIEGTNNINKEYKIDIVETAEGTDSKYSKLNMNFLIILITVEVICLLIVLVISIKNRVSKIYLRDTKSVIDPILAEAIIDRKVGAKELIMTCISNLINKGNIECIDNETIKLISNKDITGYEQRIKNLLFKNVGDVITFEQIKNMFKKDNQKTKDFYKLFKSIKKDIEKELFNKKIYSKVGKIILRSVRIITTLMYANIFYFAYYISSYRTFVEDNLFYIFNVIALIIAIVKEFGFKLNIREKTKLKLSILMYGPILLFLMLISIAYSFNTYIEAYILILVMLIINIFSSIKANTHVFTKKGKEEYKKAYGLKSYIEDYSLMKERELESIILWDDYLTYAIAFGISNKVTDRFAESLMNANINLQKIDNFLKF